MASSLSRNDASAEEGENKVTPTQALFQKLSLDEEELILWARIKELNTKKMANQQVKQLQNIQNAFLDKIGELEKKQEEKTNALATQLEVFMDKMGKMEKQQQQKNEQSEKSSIGKFSQLQNEQKALLGKISELEKQQQKKFSNSLPNFWDANGCHNNIEILGNDCLMVHYKEKRNGFSSVFAKSAMSGSEFGIFYYEIKVEKVQNSVSIGLGTKAMPSYGSVGQHLNRYAYESNGTFWVNGTSKKGKEKYTNGDVVGFGVNLSTHRIIFTKNGLRLDTYDLFLSPSSFSSTSSDHLLLFPCVTLSDCGDKIAANFGLNFQFEPANTKVYSEFRAQFNFWDVNFCHNYIAISGPNDTVVHHKETNGNDWRTVFAKYSILGSAVNPSNIFYFELKIKMRGGLFFGFAVKNYTPFNGEIAQRTGSYAYLWNGTFWINGTKKDGNETFCDGDTVGCGVNLANKQLFFTKNGRRIGVPNDFLISSSPSADSLFPFVSLWGSDDRIVANFGPKFMFDLSTLLKK